MVSFLKNFRKIMLKIFKKIMRALWDLPTWEPFGICPLNITAKPAHFHQNWTGLAVLFSRQIPNSSHNFFHTLRIIIFLYFFLDMQPCPWIFDTYYFSYRWFEWSQMYLRLDAKLEIQILKGLYVPIPRPSKWLVGNNEVILATWRKESNMDFETRTSTDLKV